MDGSARYEEVAGPPTELMPVERLATHLTAGDVETLRDLVRAVVPDNTIRAVASDLAYLEVRAAIGQSLSWPPAEADGLKFIAYHLFRDEERKARREADRHDYGTPRAVDYQNCCSTRFFGEHCSMRRRGGIIGCADVIGFAPGG